MRCQEKSVRLSLFIPLLVLFSSIAMISSADPQFRQEWNSMIAEMDKCFQQNEVSAPVCVVGIRNQCIRNFKAGRAIADWGNPRYCTNILARYAEGLLQHETVQKLALAEKENLGFSPGTLGDAFNDFMRAEVSWNDYVTSYCSAIASDSGASVARGDRIRGCRLNMIVKRIVEMRSGWPENLKGAMK